MKIFVICSKSFYNRIPMIKEKLEANGHSVTLPNSYDNPGREYEILEKSLEEHAKWKGEMYKHSEKTIKESDAILVLNYEKNGQENYIGGATFMEMYDGFRHGKPIFMMNPIPNNMLNDEIKGFMPVIIDGDLKKVR